MEVQSVSDGDSAYSSAGAAKLTEVDTSGKRAPHVPFMSAQRVALSESSHKWLSHIYYTIQYTCTFNWQNFFSGSYEYEELTEKERRGSIKNDAGSVLEDDEDMLAINSVLAAQNEHQEYCEEMQSSSLTKDENGSLGLGIVDGLVN